MQKMFYMSFSQIREKIGHRESFTLHQTLHLQGQLYIELQTGQS